MALSPSQQKKLSTIIKAKVFEAKVKSKIKAGVTRQRQPSQPGGSGFVGPVKHSPQPSPSSEERQAGVNEGQADRNKVEINKILDSLEGQPVRVTYKTPSGYSKSVQTTRFNDKFQLPFGSEFVSVSHLQPSGGTGKNILVSSVDVMSQPSRHQQFRKTQLVPDWYSSQVTIPPSIKFLGLGKEYLRYGYSKALGFTGVDYPFKTVTERKFEGLKPSRKFEYGLQFGDIKKTPVGEWKYYEGGKEYLSGLGFTEQNKIIKQYLKQNPETFGVWEKAKTGFTTGMSHSPLFGLPMFVGSLLGSKETERALNSMETSMGKRQTAWENIVYNPVERGTRQYERFNVFQRSLYSGQYAAMSATLYPVTLTQTGVKYATGKGGLTDPLGRIRSGKTLLLPDVGKTLQETKIGGPSGLLSVGVSEGIGKVTGEGSDEWKKAQKYPVETFFATSGEIAGLYAGGKAVQLFKVGVGKVTSPIARSIESRFGIQSLSAYRPTNLLRKVWWKGKEKLGYAQKLPEEQVWDPSVLSGKTKFAELPGASKQLKLFRSTVTPKGEIVGIHAASRRFGRLTLIPKGSSETPGMSISVFGRGSPHFLRVGGGYSYGGLPPASRLSLLPQLWRPTAPLFNLKNVFRLPKFLRRSGYKQSGKYIMGQPRGPYGWIAPKAEMGGPELEAIIRGGNIGLRTSNFYYTSFKGVVVPLPSYRLLGSGMPKGFAAASSKIPNTVKDFFSASYQTSPSISLFSPSYLLSRIGSSRPSSSPSYKSIPSYPSFGSMSSARSVFSTPSYGSFRSMPSSLGSIGSSGYSSRSLSSLSSSLGSMFSSPSYKSIPSRPSYPSYPSSPSISSSSVVPSYSIYPLTFGPDTGKKSRRPMDLLGKGYRHRRWKVPTMESMITGGKENMDMGMKKAKRNDVNSLEIITLKEFLPKRKKSKKNDYGMFTF